jgi:flavin reductase (DIM6/NTAB) family NADH-FMN oxidoreductase RutF
MSGSIAALFQRLTQGVYVVGVAHGEVRNAFTAAWVMQVSFDPLLLALSINPHHSSYGLLRDGRAFSVNVLKKGQLELAAQCQVVGEHPAGDHVLVLGKVIDGKLLGSKAEPMTYRETGAMDGASALFPDVFGD